MKLKGEIRLCNLVLIDKESLDELKKADRHWKTVYFGQRVDEDAIKTRRFSQLERRLVERSERFVRSGLRKTALKRKVKK